MQNSALSAGGSPNNNGGRLGLSQRDLNLQPSNSSNHQPGSKVVHERHHVSPKKSKHSFQLKQHFWEMDTDHKMISLVQGFSIYQHKDKCSTDDQQHIQPCVERVFRTICSQNDEKETPETSIKNLRVKQQKLKRYLIKRYNARMANKLCALFDWSKRELDFKEFYQQYDQIFQNSGVMQMTEQLEVDTHLIALKQIAFNLYDMNCDHHICQYDLFSVIKHVNNELFIDAINQDIKDVRRRIQKKEAVEKFNYDKVSPFDVEKNKIKNLSEWLNQ